MALEKIESVADILETQKYVVDEFKGSVPWWRGHADSTWNLVPYVHRIALPRYEQNISLAFFHEAKSRYSNYPPNDNTSAWLSLMQHYRLPTRLLDWSETCLVAAYFAVSNKKLQSIPSAMWALWPSELNKNQIGKEVTVASNHESLSNHFEASVHGNPKNEEKEKTTIAFNPEETDIRMMVQASKFTIHSDATPIEMLDKAGSFLRRFEIPPEAKEKILEELDSLKINRATLFPDLENLAKDIMTRNYGYEK